MLDRIHPGHMGIENSKRRARDVLYWPGMNSQISDKMNYLSGTPKPKFKRANDPFSYTKQALGNGSHWHIHMGQVRLPFHCRLVLTIF